MTARLSATMSGRSPRNRHASVDPGLARACKARRSQQLLDHLRGANGSGVISKSPVSIFDMSRMPFTTDKQMMAGIVDELRIFAPALGIDAASSLRCVSISEKPMIALSGVRNSWLMVARKRVLAALARSDSARAILDRLLLLLALGDVAHHGDHFAVAACRTSPTA